MDEPDCKYIVKAEKAELQDLGQLISELFDFVAATAVVEVGNSLNNTHWQLEIYLQDTKAHYELIAEFCKQCLTDATLPQQEIEVEKLPTKDWVSHVQSNLRPVIAGRYFVHGSHDRHKRPGSGISIEVEAGQAFGTGHHGTTTGCLVLIDRLLKKRSVHRALDLGTGSGILAMAVALASTANVIATDIDPVAVKTARDNAQLNSCHNKVDFIVSKGFDHKIFRIAPGFDLIIANILAAPLAELAPEIIRQAKASDYKVTDIILSGILQHQAKRLIALYQINGARLVNKIDEDGWICLHLRLKNS